MFMKFRSDANFKNTFTVYSVLSNFPTKVLSLHNSCDWQELAETLRKMPSPLLTMTLFSSHHVIFAEKLIEFRPRILYNLADYSRLITDYHNLTLLLL